MAWTTQFYHEYYDPAGQLCRIDFKEDNPPFNQLVDAAPEPIKFIRPGKDIFDVVRGSGCVMTVISPTDKYFLGLINATMAQYRIEHRVAGTLVWFGYLNSEMYRESYSETTNYYVELTGNNGFSLLERIKFLDGSGDPYTGLLTQWDVLQIILDKWGLMSLVSLVKVAISTTSTEITIGGGETILEHTYVSCHNYYDEDGEPWTCRRVLNDLLAPYGAVMQMEGAAIVITDINSMAGDISFQTYTNTYVFNGQQGEAAAGVQDLEDDIGYYETGQQLDGVPAVNRQVVRYSKYTPDDLTDKIQDLAEMTFDPPTTEPEYDQIITCGGGSYISDNIIGITDWSFDVGASLRIGGAKEETDGEPEFYIRILNPEGGTPLDHTYYDDDHSQWLLPSPYVVGNNGHYIKIEGELFPLTRTDPYVEEGSPCTDVAEFDHVVLLARLVVGGFLYRVDTKVWIAYPGTIQPEHQFRIYAGEADENVANKWSPFKVLPWTHSNTKKHPVADDAVYIYLEPGIYGQIQIEFTRQMYAWKGGVIDEDETVYIDEMWIKDLKVSVVTNPGFIDQSGNDLEYVGEMNQAWKDEGEDIILNHGCSGVDGTPFDNGALIYKDGSDYFQFTEWTRGGQTAVIEKLLLNSVESNREGSTIQLSVTINNTTGIQSRRFIDDTFMNGKMFMVTGSTLDPANGSEEIILQEVIADTHTIS